MNAWKICRQLAAAAFCVIGAAAGAQTTWYVSMTGVDSNDAGRGLSWELPFRTISNGVAHALTAGDTVMVSNGVYTNMAELIVSRDITLKSANGAAATMIDGNHPAITNRCLQVQSRGAIVDGFTICNGYAPVGPGGGLYINRGGTVVNCHIVSNQSGSGSGYGGGGVAINATGVVANCLIAWNITPLGNSSGGGVSFQYGTTNALLVNCTVEHNTSTRHAAGIYFSEGGIARSCLVRHNRTDGGSGGGAALFYAGLMENCTIVSNLCTTGDGGGVYMASSSSGTGAVVNSIVCFNQSRSAATTNFSITGVGIFSNSCYYPSLPAASEAVSGNNTTNNPLFAGFAEGDYRLLPESPCVDTGMLRSWMPGSDLDGHAVPDRFSGLPDMGCCELVRQGVMFKLK